MADCLVANAVASTALGYGARHTDEVRRDGGDVMLIGGTYTTRMDSEEKIERNLQLFMNWTPPEGFEFLHHWARADGNGGVFIAEAASAAAILEATAPWGPNLEFDIAPLVDITEAVPTFLKVQEWTKGVG